MNRIVHFEIPVKDIMKAKEFFESVFKWDIVTHEGDNGSITTIETGSVSEPGINGSFFRKSTVPPDFGRIINAIEVEDIETMRKRVEANGGEIVFGPIQYADLGKMMYFKDTEGNILGMLERK